MKDGHGFESLVRSNQVRSSNRQFELQVLVHARPVREYPHNGEVFVEGRSGSDYALRVYNHSTRRVAVVLSVDGLSVMTGTPARSSDPAYILGPYGSMEVPGWRLNNENVAHFAFGQKPDAYATQMGMPANIGVIGALFYYEQLGHHLMRSSSPVITRGDQYLGAMPGEKQIGTVFGEETAHHVQGVDFKREHSPADAPLALRYDTAEGLQRRGIVLAGPHQVDDAIIAAQPFPGDQVGATPPPNWRPR